MDRYCDHCKTRGHNLDQSFKIHGYPDWYKGEQHKTGTKVAAQVSCDIGDAVQDTLFGDDGVKAEGQVDSALMQVVCHEVLRALKSKGVASQESTISSNFAGKISNYSFVSNAVDFHNVFGTYGWIVDT